MTVTSMSHEIYTKTIESDSGFQTSVDTDGGASSINFGPQWLRKSVGDSVSKFGKSGTFTSENNSKHVNLAPQLSESEHFGHNSSRSSASAPYSNSRMHILDMKSHFFIDYGTALPSIRGPELAKKTELLTSKISPVKLAEKRYAKDEILALFSGKGLWDGYMEGDKLVEYPDELTGLNGGFQEDYRASSVIFQEKPYVPINLQDGKSDEENRILMRNANSYVALRKAFVGTGGPPNGFIGGESQTSDTGSFRPRGDFSGFNAQNFSNNGYVGNRGRGRGRGMTLYDRSASSFAPPNSHHSQNTTGFQQNSGVGRASRGGRGSSLSASFRGGMTNGFMTSNDGPTSPRKTLNRPSDVMNWRKPQQSDQQNKSLTADNHNQIASGGPDRWSNNNPNTNVPPSTSSSRRGGGVSGGGWSSSQQNSGRWWNSDRGGNINSSSSSASSNNNNAPPLSTNPSEMKRMTVDDRFGFDGLKRGGKEYIMNEHDETPYFKNKSDFRKEHEEGVGMVKTTSNDWNEKENTPENDNFHRMSTTITKTSQLKSKNSSEPLVYEEHEVDPQDLLVQHQQQPPPKIHGHLPPPFIQHPSQGFDNKTASQSDTVSVIRNHSSFPDNAHQQHVDQKGGVARVRDPNERSSHGNQLMKSASEIMSVGNMSVMPSTSMTIDKSVSNLSLYGNNSCDKKLGSGGVSWLYLDPQRIVQGPFSNQEMLDWFTAGYFQPTLMLRRSIDAEFVSLRQMSNSVYNGKVPFTVSDSIPPPIQTGNGDTSTMNALSSSGGGTASTLTGGSHSIMFDRHSLNNVPQHQQHLSSNHTSMTTSSTSPQLSIPFSTPLGDQRHSPLPTIFKQQQLPSGHSGMNFEIPSTCSGGMMMDRSNVMLSHNPVGVNPSFHAPHPPSTSSSMYDQNLLSSSNKLLNSNTGMNHQIINNNNNQFINKGVGNFPDVNSLRQNSTVHGGGVLIDSTAFPPPLSMGSASASSGTHHQTFNNQHNTMLRNNFGLNVSVSSSLPPNLPMFNSQSRDSNVQMERGGKVMQGIESSSLHQSSMMTRTQMDNSFKPLTISGSTGGGQRDLSGIQLSTPASSASFTRMESPRFMNTENQSLNSSSVIPQNGTSNGFLFGEGSSLVTSSVNNRSNETKLNQIGSPFIDSNALPTHDFSNINNPKSIGGGENGLMNNENGGPTMSDPIKELLRQLEQQAVTKQNQPGQNEHQVNILKEGHPVDLPQQNEQRTSAKLEDNLLQKNKRSEEKMSDDESSSKEHENILSIPAQNNNVVEEDDFIQPKSLEKRDKKSKRIEEKRKQAKAQANEMSKNSMKIIPGLTSHNSLLEDTTMRRQTSKSQINTVENNIESSVESDQMVVSQSQQTASSGGGAMVGVTTSPKNPWLQSSETTSSGGQKFENTNLISSASSEPPTLSLAQIQKMERQKMQQQANAQSAKVAKQQNGENRQNNKNWSSPPNHQHEGKGISSGGNKGSKNSHSSSGTPPPPVLSLAEIQAEQARIEAEKREVEVAEKNARLKEMEAIRPSNWSTAVSGSVSSNPWSGSKAQFSWANKSKQTVQQAQGGQNSKVQVANNVLPNVSSSSEGFWDTTTNDSPTKGSSNDNGFESFTSSIACNKNKKKSGATKGCNSAVSSPTHQIQSVNGSSIKGWECPLKQQFEGWVSEALRAFPGIQIDIPTFINFLLEVDNPDEINDYVKAYIGESRAAKHFSKEYLERRSKYRNAVKQQNRKGSEENLCKPALAINPIDPLSSSSALGGLGGFQDVVSKKSAKNGNNKRGGGKNQKK